MMEPEARKIIQRAAYRVSEVAKMTGISAPTIYRQIYDGKIPSVKIGDVVTIPAWWVTQTFEKSASAA